MSDQFSSQFAFQFASQCAGIANEIAALEAEREGMQQELASAPPSLKPFLLREIRRINVELGRLRQQLSLCQQNNPPAPRPDLVARSVRLRVNHAEKTVGFAAEIKNIGRGNAHGPFRIDLAATLLRGGVTTSFVQVFEVPAGFTLFGEQVLTQSVEFQQAAFAAFPGGNLPIFSQEYVTDFMTVPLHYRDESPSATYDLEFIVDSEQRIMETNEGNNHFFARWWTTRPGSNLNTTPFKVELKSGKGETGSD
jgi:hypothetical protein